MAAANQEYVEYGKRTWDRWGKIGHACKGVERLLVEAWVRKEQRRLWELAEVRAGHMVMIPLGWRYLTPEQQELTRVTGTMRVKSIGWNKITIQKVCDVKRTT